MSVPVIGLGDRGAYAAASQDAAAADLLAIPQPPVITEAGIRININVGIQYVESWLGGQGCVPIHHLMEDAATAEISRSQLWQWLQNGAKLADGRTVDRPLYEKLRDEEMAKLTPSAHLQEARKILDSLATGEFVEFLTLPAYELLE